MIDSHCHLDHEPLFSNIDEIIKRSKQTGLKKILTISTNFKSFENIKRNEEAQRLSNALMLELRRNTTVVKK